MADGCDEQNTTRINHFFSLIHGLWIEEKGVIGKEKGTTHGKWGN
jgi:ribonuclease I